MNDLDRTIAVAQMDCNLSDVGANLDKIEKFAGLARVLGAQLVVFPECATTGYFVGDALPSLADHPDGPITRQLATIAKENRIHRSVVFTRRRTASSGIRKCYSHPMGNCSGPIIRRICLPPSGRFTAPATTRWLSIRHWDVSA